MTKPRIRSYSFIRILRRSVFSDVRYPVGVAMMEDTLCLSELLLRKAIWARTDLRCYGYRQRVDSVSHQLPESRPLDVIEVTRRVIKNLKNGLQLSRGELYRTVLFHYEQVVTYFLSIAMDNPTKYHALEVTKAYFRCCELTNSRIAKLGIHLQAKVLFLTESLKMMNLSALAIRVCRKVCVMISPKTRA